MDIHRQRRFLVILVCVAYLLVAITAIEETLALEFAASYLLIIATLGYVMTLICIHDARINDKPLNHFSFWLIFFFWPIATPICLIRTRGWRGLWIIFLHSLGFVFCAFVAAVVAQIVFSRRIELF